LFFNGVGMPNPAQASLSEAMRADARAAWQYLRGKYPTEKFYAFGLYTTEMGSYFGAFACGEEGLTRVAEKYVADGTYRTLEKARTALRWSIPDSPYHAEVTSMDERTQPVLAGRPDPYDLSDAASLREVRARMNAAVTALQALDQEGLFGTGDARSALTLLIEAGDRENDFVLKWAKKLNPPDVYKAFKKIFTAETLGTFTEFGTKKVYQIQRLAVSTDRRLLGAAGWHYAFLFDVKEMKQLFCKSIKKDDRSVTIHEIKMSSDGGTIVVAGEGVLRILRGPGWKNQVDIPLGGKPSSMAISPDGSWVALSSFGRNLTIFNSQWERIRSLEVDAWAWKIDMSPDGSRLGTMDPKGGLRLWNTADWSLRRHIKVSGDCVSLDSTGCYAATTWYVGDYYENGVRVGTLSDPEHQRRVVAIWDLDSGELVRELTMPGYTFKVARFSPDGRTLAVSAQPIKWEDGVNDDALLFDVADGRLIDKLRGPFQAIEDFVFLPERNAIAFAAYGHTLRPLTMWQLGG
jgi:hypothetical protein